MKLYATIPLNIIITQVRERIMASSHTHNVEIKSIDVSGEAHEYDESDLDEAIIVNALVDNTDAPEYSTNKYFHNCNGIHPWLLVWNNEENVFDTIMRLDQECDHEIEPAGEE